MRYIIILMLFPLFLNAQTPKGTGELPRFSLEVEGGKINSKERVIYARFCDRCPLNIDKFIAADTKYTALIANYRINDRQQLGVGYARTQHGYEYVFRWENYKPVLMNYHTLKLRHRITLLQGSHFSFSIANAFDIERKGKPNDEFWINKSVHINKYGLSHLVEFTFGAAIGRNLKLNLSPVVRTSITKYSDLAFDRKDFRRYGYGMLLGLEYGIGQYTSIFN